MDRPRNPPLGEVGGRRGRVRGITSPRFLGQNVCGSQDTWQNGALLSQLGTPTVDDEGVPPCCISGPHDQGGLDLNGGAYFNPPNYAGVKVGCDMSEPGSMLINGVRVGLRSLEPPSTTIGGVRISFGSSEPEQSIGGVRVGGEMSEPSATTESGFRVGGVAGEPPLGADVIGGVRVGGSAIEPSANIAGVRVGGDAGEPESAFDAGVRVGGDTSQTVGEECVSGFRIGGETSEPHSYVGCSQCPLGTWLQWDISISGGTGDFAIFNGIIHSDPASGCFWSTDRLVDNIQGGLNFTLGDANLNIFQTVSPFASLGFTSPVDCIGPNVLVLHASTGSGTPPATATITGV